MDLATIETATDAIMRRATNPDFTREQGRRKALHAAHNPAGVKFTRALGPKTKASGVRGAVWTPEQIAEIIPADGAAVLYASFGHVGGMECFSRSTFVVNSDGTGISVIDKAGNVSLGYPFSQGRTLRLMVK